MSSSKEFLKFIPFVPVNLHFNDGSVLRVKALDPEKLGGPFQIIIYQGAFFMKSTDLGAGIEDYAQVKRLTASIETITEGN